MGQQSENGGEIDGAGLGNRSDQDSSGPRSVQGTENRPLEIGAGMGGFNSVDAGSSISPAIDDIGDGTKGEPTRI